jgi:5-methylcytosine-specific restriction enzyme subunit McrC
VNPVETIKLKEYENTTVELDSLDATFILEKLPGKISISRDVTGQSYILNPCQYVGVIALPSGRHLESHPKMPISNLFYLLAVAFELPSPFRPELVRLDRLDQILEFIAEFFTDLVQDRIASGLYRWYVEREENVPAIRGRIKFDEDVRQNAVLRQRTYCRFDEFTWDIPENQILRQVARLLSGWRFRPELRLRLGQIDSELSEVTRTQFSAQSVERIHYHRLNEGYRQLHQLCRLFLEGSSLSETVGGFTYQAFLLDMNKLFEAFVCQILRDRVSSSLRVDTQDRIYLDRGERILMKPDILIRRRGTVILAGDCKYKRLESHEFKNHDVYQLLAYCTATNTRTGLLVYPLNQANTQDTVQIQNTDIVVRQVSIDLGKELTELVRSCNSFADEVFTCAEM